MLGPCILSAPTLEKLEELINESYCSVNYTVNGNLVYNRKTLTCIDGMWVYKARNGRWQMRRVIKDEKKS
jgi:hypothetical protein